MDRATFEHILKRRAGRSQLLTGGAIVAGVGSAAVGLWLAVLGARGRGNSATRAPADTTRERS